MLSLLRAVVVGLIVVASLTAHSQQNYHIETLAEGLEFPWSLANHRATGAFAITGSGRQTAFREWRA